MKNGWNFFVGLAGGFLLAVGVTVLAFCLNLGVHTPSSRWAYQITQRKESLARQRPPPRLLLVGGSATLFGINARELEQQTGWPTLNLGTHAALGTAYLLREAQQLAQPGDTVLLVLEYELYNSGTLTLVQADPLLVDYIVARAPDYFQTLSPEEKWNVFMLTGNQRLVRGLKNRKRPERPASESPTSVYTVSRLDRWGDQTGHGQACRPDGAHLASQKPSSVVRSWNETPSGFPFIAAFCVWARTNHVRVLATYPNLMDHPLYHTAPARQNIQKIAAFYARSGVPVVGEYTDALLPADQFFDTVYHLTEEAAAGRTRRLADQLKPLLQEHQTAWTGK